MSTPAPATAGQAADMVLTGLGYLAALDATTLAARAHLGWARRAAAHPQVVAALAGGTVLTESIARLICGWTDKLPAGRRPPIRPAPAGPGGTKVLHSHRPNAPPARAG